MPDQTFTGVLETGVQSTSRSIPRLKLEFSEGDGLRLQYTCTFNYCGDAGVEDLPTKRIDAAILALVQSLNNSPTDQAKKLCKKVVDSIATGRANFERLTAKEKSDWINQIAQLQAHRGNMHDYRPEIQWMEVLLNACRPGTRCKPKNVAYRVRLFKQLMLRLIGRSPSIAVYMAACRSKLLPSQLFQCKTSDIESAASLILKALAGETLPDLRLYCVDVAKYVSH
ncbi:hypothetical protein HII31_12472 [Pseudocercospora fuligena]|uniref:Uncharacterized protein n=1 Tax=Pseudocercospora fuligena TaxID=685502 RepID=A0A8H6VGP2_9PEZI|nr:hypothetical protein HII31_12472 [Pseudocercospora fuligena]